MLYYPKTVLSEPETIYKTIHRGGIMHILLAGRGNMAQAVRAACKLQGIKVTRFGEDFDHTNKSYGNTVAIHFGSGKELPGLIQVCEMLSVPIIQGSTGISDLPTKRNVTIVNAPNLSLPMLRFMASFPAFAKSIGENTNIRIVESHQERKRGVSGTAIELAKSLGISQSCIKSVRDPDVQRALGIPKEHLEAHAHHRVTFTGAGIEFTVSTKVNGRETYADGAIAIAREITALDEPLKSGVYDLLQLPYLIPGI